MSDSRTVIRPSIAADGCPMQALIVRAIDQYPAHAEARFSFLGAVEHTAHDQANWVMTAVALVLLPIGSDYRV